MEAVSAERDTLRSRADELSGRLAALIFGRQGRIVRYIEIRSDEVEFRGAEANLSPETAVFRVVSRADGDDPVVLSVIP